MAGLMVAVVMMTTMSIRNELVQKNSPASAMRKSARGLAGHQLSRQDVSTIHRAMKQASALKKKGAWKPTPYHDLVQFPKKYGFKKNLFVHGAKHVKHSAKAQALSQEYNDYGKQARGFYVKHHLMSQKENDWANSLMTGKEKSRVQILHQNTQNKLPCGRGGPCPVLGNFLQKSGLVSPAESQWARTMGVENAAVKAPVTMLASKPSGAKQGQDAKLGEDLTKFLFRSSHTAGF
uniref:Uncharacterized protein n=1 Tax=Hanusia phi TaxID=3032 RepID=A0A7S0EYJ8_9CRYP